MNKVITCRSKLIPVIIFFLFFWTSSVGVGEDTGENKGTGRMIKGVVVLICCVLPGMQPFALSSLMENSVRNQGEAL